MFVRDKGSWEGTQAENLQVRSVTIRLQHAMCSAKSTFLLEKVVSVPHTEGMSVRVDLFTAETSIKCQSRQLGSQTVL